MKMSIAAAEAPTGRRTFVVSKPLTRIRTFLTPVARQLTDEAKDVPDGGDEDDQGVGASQQDHGDDDVADPAEVLGGAQEVVDRGADLQGGAQKRSQRQGSSNGFCFHRPFPFWGHLRGKAPQGR